MKKYLIAAALIVGFSAPSLALGTFYIMFDTKTRACSMMTSIPSGSRYKMLGSYWAAISQRDGPIKRWPEWRSADKLNCAARCARQQARAPTVQVGALSII
jgi:hypothetical protein